MDREEARETEDMLPRLSPSQFTQQISQLAQAAFAREGEQFTVLARGRLLKVWRGEDSAVHYEVAVHERELQIEIGLHMEASPERNSAIYREIDRCLFELRDQLGSRIWLEPWARGWARLYETEGLLPLDAARAAAVADRLVEFVRVVQPVYEAILVRLDG